MTGAVNHPEPEGKGQTLPALVRSGETGSVRYIPQVNPLSLCVVCSDNRSHLNNSNMKVQDEEKTWRQLGERFILIDLLGAMIDSSQRR